MPVRRVVSRRPVGRVIHKSSPSVNDDGAYGALSGKKHKQPKQQKLKFGSKHKRR